MKGKRPHAGIFRVPFWSEEQSGKVVETSAQFCVPGKPSNKHITTPQPTTSPTKKMKFLLSFTCLLSLHGAALAQKQQQLATAPPPPLPCASTHTVIWGDTCWRVAQTLGLESWQLLDRWNAGACRRWLQMGQVLCVSEPTTGLGDAGGAPVSGSQSEPTAGEGGGEPFSGGQSAQMTAAVAATKRGSKRRMIARSFLDEL
ncbi:hypothetical protein BDK51DRAFT_48076 [Blyttiomyces helicus]|uniref:LysM domain-containing protein n=1 Tax=Blyttiomyces helicus TaxID=388810 RepID=A0A4P9WH61_9FUNG|nr:hypothetical protein BDK51DRAFT_48076 [Blyttiomyces helicus]|eukprot:RKO90738.1 hypothetical protein BDK51DRAFT_48076 [Blyttiomyces helicus]